LFTGVPQVNIRFMTRRPPSILSFFSTSDGGIEVNWEVDSFFPDSAEPEKVLIDLNGVPFKELDGDETSVEIPLEKLVAFGVAQVAISVSFAWSGPPAETLQSVVLVPIQIGGAVGGGVVPAAKPIVTVVHVQPRTVLTASNIEIAWKSNNYNDGNIFWGPKSAPEAFRRNIRPVGEVYHGTFTTNQPLSPATQYVFKVEVRNTLQSPRWISTTIMVRSAPDTLSVREFLIASGRPVTSSLAALVGPAKSLHKMLVG
jgi:hypothetical protein